MTVSNPQCLTDDCQLVAAAGRRQLRSSDGISLRQPHLSLGQFRRALKCIYLTVSNLRQLELTFIFVCIRYPDTPVQFRTSP